MVLRRTFLAGAALVFAPRRRAAAEAPRRIGILAQDLQPGLLDTFRAGLGDFGYEDGKNVALLLRNAEGHSERLAAMAADLIANKVEIILAINTVAAKAAQKATSTVPIIIMRVADPIKSHLIQSLARPGGNITGLYFMPDVLGAKGVELLHETLPKVSRVGALYSGDNPGGLIVVEETERRCMQLGIAFTRLPVKNAEDDKLALEKAAGIAIEALFVMDDGAVTKRRRDILDLATAHRLPVVSIYRDFADAGALFAYGPSLPAMYRRGGYFVDRLLKGAAPQTLPVEQPTKFDLFINLKTAKSLGIAIPPAVLVRADEVIE
ncbi:MAG TPA: ABC transporter substrate-binding protein [Stellaceae bacterium]|nr:ABC transporter substrate-binding protein [Stellaceae bacterium]